MDAEEENLQEIYTLINDKMKEVIRKQLAKNREEVSRDFMIEAAKILVSNLHFDPVEVADYAMNDLTYDDAEYNDNEDDEADDELSKEDLTPLLKPWSRKKHVVFDNYDCAVCGSRIRFKSKAGHERTVKHKQAQEIWLTRFEMQ